MIRRLIDYVRVLKSRCQSVTQKKNEDFDDFYDNKNEGMIFNQDEELMLM